MARKNLTGTINLAVKGGWSCLWQACNYNATIFFAKGDGFPRILSINV